MELFSSPKISPTPQSFSNPNGIPSYGDHRMHSSSPQQQNEHPWDVNNSNNDAFRRNGLQRQVTEKFANTKEKRVFVEMKESTVDDVFLESTQILTKKNDHGTFSSSVPIGQKGNTQALTSLFHPSPPTIYVRPFERPNETIQPDNENKPLSPSRQNKMFSCLCSKECIRTTSIGSFTFVLFHIVYCLAQASAIPRPHSTNSILGPMVRSSALGPIICVPIYLYLLRHCDFQAFYPTLDIFCVPFLAQQAIIVDEMLFREGNENDDDKFLTTFCVLSGIGIVLSGVMNILVTRFKLANLGNFLPFPVMCGFFSAIGLMVWMLAFSVDTGGKQVGVLFGGNFNEIKDCMAHHIPSIIAAACMISLGPNKGYLPLITIGTMLIVYGIIFITGSTLEEARNQGWFWRPEDFQSSKTTFLQDPQTDLYGVPLPFGVIAGIMRGNVCIPAIVKGLPISFAMATIYLVRCSLHAPALKKQAESLLKWEAEQQESTEHELNGSEAYIPIRDRADTEDSDEKNDLSSNIKTKPIVMNEVFLAYGKNLILSGLLGGATCLPAIGASSTLFKVRGMLSSPFYFLFSR